jgi:hypothetical protein
MHLHASWKALFALITTVNEAGDRNVAGFTGAMELEASLGKKMTKLVQPFVLLLAANDKKGITILHHPFRLHPHPPIQQSGLPRRGWLLRSPRRA